MQEPDYIIIGAGSAGSIMAARLSEQPCTTVTLFEAGGSDKHMMISMPFAWMPASMMPRFTWGTKTDPEPSLDGRELDLPRGRIMGGCGSIDGRMYIRGAAADYDAWRDQGLAGWGYADVLPYFRRTETNWRGGSDLHGAEGPVSVVPLKPHKILYPAFEQAARSLGYPIAADFNVPQPEGFGLPDVMAHKGQRHSSVRAYVDPVRSRANLDVKSDTLVRRVVIEGHKAVGVEYEQGGETRILRARREVILCAGTFHSPHVLMLSGIGPAAELSRSGIETIVDLPGVGANLQDHPIALTFWGALQPITFERELRFDRLAYNVAKWLLTGRGTPAQSPLSLQGFLRSGPDQERPDLQFQASHVHYGAKPWFPVVRKGIGHAISAGTILLNPESRGRVSLVSSDPRALPRIQLNFLEAEGDRVRLRESVRLMRALMQADPLKPYVGPEVAPGAAADGDEAIDAWNRATVMSGAHAAGTCAMGTGVGAVVDAALRVRGVENLRVVDCSVMPVIVRGNTAAPVMMIAEKAADLVSGRPTLRA